MMHHEEPPTGFQRFETSSTYSPPAKQVRFHVELLRDNPFPKGVLGSKAIGEPPFMHLGIADPQRTFQVEGFGFGRFQGLVLTKMSNNRTPGFLMFSLIFKSIHVQL